MLGLDLLAAQLIPMMQAPGYDQDTLDEVYRRLYDTWCCLDPSLPRDVATRSQESLDMFRKEHNACRKAKL